METLILPIPPTLNELTDINRGSKYRANNNKQYWQELIRKYILEQNICKFNSKIFIIVEFYFKNINRDYDNLDGSLKVVFDTLKTNIIKDDSAKNIWGFVPKFYWHESCGLVDNIVVIHLTDQYDEFMFKFSDLVNKFDNHYQLTKAESAKLSINARSKAIKGVSLE